MSTEEVIDHARDLLKTLETGRKARIDAVLELERMRGELKNREAAIMLAGDDNGEPLINGKNSEQRAAQLREFLDMDPQYADISGAIDRLQRQQMELDAEIASDTEAFRLDRLILMLSVSPSVLEALA